MNSVNENVSFTLVRPVVISPALVLPVVISPALVRPVVISPALVLPVVISPALFLPVVISPGLARIEVERVSAITGVAHNLTRVFRMGSLFTPY